MSVRICLLKTGALPVLSDECKNQRVGGEEVQHALLAKALAKRGHDVRLVVGDYGQPHEAMYDGVQTIRSFREGAGLPVIRFVHPRWTGLWQALSRADAQVYYVSCAGMELGLAAMLCERRGARLVFRAASDADCDPARLLVPYRRDKWLYEYGLKRANAVLVQTEHQQRLMLQHYGVDAQVADMLVEGLGGGAAVRDIDVLWVANLRDVKRPDRLIALAKALPHLRFHMAGGAFPGQADLYRRIEQEARALPNLQFHGAVAYRDIGRLFDRARLFVNTSDLEGFPNTFLQAWARGVPVAALFDPDGVIATHGLGAAVADEPSLVAAVKRLLEDASAYDTAQHAARTFAERQFGEAKVLAPYLAAFQLPPADEARPAPALLELG